jgi:hypothetical protein
MSGLLIDEKGRCWPDDWDLARRIGYADPRMDIPTFAVCRRGFIHLRHHGGIARVSLRERHFNLITFAGALLELGRIDPTRIILRVFGEDSPAYHVFTDLYDFAAQAEPMATGTALEMRLPRLAEARNLRVLNFKPFAGARPIVDRRPLATDERRAVRRHRDCAHRRRRPRSNDSGAPTPEVGSARHRGIRFVDQVPACRRYHRP